MKTRHVMIAALLAAMAGGAAGLLLDRQSVLVGSQVSQQAIQQVLAAGAPPTPEGLTVAVRGQPVPEVPVRDLDGAPVDLAQALAGRATVVNLWATWCAPCLKEMPELQAYARAQGDAGVQVAGVALDEAAAVRDFVREHGIDYPQWIDTPGAADAGVRLGNPRGVLPFTVLLDQAGMVREMRVGPFDSVAQIEDWVERSLRAP